TEAELGGLRRSRDDVSRDLRARLLSRAAHLGAHRVSRAPVCRRIAPRAHPSPARPHHARAAWTYLARRVALPMLRRKVDRLSRVPPLHPAVVPLAVLSPQAAAMPTEQPR